MNRIRDYIKEGKIDSAIKLCRKEDTPSAHMIEKGITRIGRPVQDVQVAIENVGNIEVSKLEKGLVLMATIAAGAPMLGFLGTVLGMIQTFYNMAQNAGGVIEIASLSDGMYQAMVTTVGGLIVGILAMFAYNLLVSRIDRVVRQLESRTMEFMDLLNEPA
jgi:biopolymer transport protein ExbB